MYVGVSLYRVTNRGTPIYVYIYMGSLCKRAPLCIRTSTHSYPHIYIFNMYRGTPWRTSYEWFCGRRFKSKSDPLAHRVYPFKEGSAALTVGLVNIRLDTSG